MTSVRVPIIRIPPIDDEKLNTLVDRIKPVIEFDGVKCYIAPCDPRRVAYTWSPAKAEPAPALQPIADVRMYHTWGHYSLFKPSIAEVLSQIPEHLVERVTEFEIVTRPQTAEDLNEENRALNAGFHVSTCRLYERATDETVHDLQSPGRPEATGRTEGGEQPEQ